ncbi:MAG: beta-phosphoglucomutase [Bacteroidales bacterium]|nr:beta-phosphoglucomutase [Bacteroidales bacterium]
MSSSPFTLYPSPCACIFDLDGVLVDTAKYHYLAWKRLAEELGFYFSKADNERLKGVSRMASLDILLEVGGITNLGDREKSTMADRKNAWYVEYIAKMTPDEILPNALDFLHELKTAGIKIALGSASKNAGMILQRVNITSFFDAVIDGNKITNAKPDPEVFLLGARELGVQPTECIVFEDAAAGIEAAIRAEMKCVGVGDPDILRRADIVIPGFQSFSWDKLLSLMKQDCFAANVARNDDEKQSSSNKQINN